MCWKLAFYNQHVCNAEILTLSMKWRVGRVAQAKTQSSQWLLWGKTTVLSKQSGAFKESTVWCSSFQLPIWKSTHLAVCLCREQSRLLNLCLAAFIILGSLSYNYGWWQTAMNRSATVMSGGRRSASRNMTGLMPSRWLRKLIKIPNQNEKVI